MRATGAFCAWIALLTVSCAPAAAPSAGPVVAEPAPIPRASSAAAPQSAAKEARAGAEQALQARLGEALRYVAEVRGLPATAEVRGRLIARDEIERYVSGLLDEETPKDVLEATEAMLYGFGTVDADFDYRKSVIGLMTSQLLGFYDPKQKTFFVGGDLHGDEADVTLWHELVHALQDQHYDLSHLTDWQPDLGDSQAAIHALAEGDATSAMLDAMLKPRGATALEMPDGLMRAQSLLGSAALTAPPVLVRSLLAPYVDGLAFTNFLRRKGGFAAVDEAWRAPPVSTEQLLHPEKYLAQEPPLVVSLPSAPAHAPDLALRFHDVMGEQTLRLLLEEWLPARTAAESAADWGGDRLAVFSDEGRKQWAIGWHLRFDSEAAAKRAFVAFARSAPLTERGSEHQPLADRSTVAKLSGDKVCRARHSQGPLALVRRGADLGVTVGPFTRTGVAVTRDLGCPAALAWADMLLTH
jgi:hypothetical protein